MRLVARHAEVGYLVPGNRPGCRNCCFMSTEEDGLGYQVRQACDKHGFEVTSGGICDSHSPMSRRASVQPGQLRFPNLGSDRHG